MSKNTPGVFLLGLLAALLTSCGADEPHVVLYVSADDYVARPIVKAFEEQSGVRVDMVADTEQKKTVGLVRRLLAEKDNPQADVFWSSEVFNTIRLANEGVLAEHDSAIAADRPRSFRDREGRWYGFAARARVIVYAPDRVAAEDVPHTWMGLTDSRFRGRIVMADPRFGTTGGHLGAMKVFWAKLAGAFYYDAFLMGLADNEVRLLPGGNAGVVRAVADGEADLGLTDTDDVWAAQRAGLNVQLTYPRHAIDGVSNAGTLLIPNTVAVIAGGPNPAQAAMLVDFLLSEQVERMLAESVSHNVPVRDAVAADYSEYAVPDPLKVSLPRVAAAMPGAIDAAMRLLDGSDAP
jgi:iron(III) transport system substrate-binding protein